MGLVIDSSLLVETERLELPISDLLSSLEGDDLETEFLLSSITLMELEHGWHRAVKAEIAIKRRRYLDEIFAIIPVEPFTREMARTAARVDAEMKATGVRIATADLLIGVTALYHDYGIATRNLRHFSRIPGLKVLTW